MQLLEKDTKILKYIAINGPSYGYKIIEDTEFAQTEDIEYNSRKTYATLKKLEKGGFIDIFDIEHNPGLDKKIYDLTYKGLFIVLSKLNVNEKSKMRVIIQNQYDKFLYMSDIFKEWKYILDNNITRDRFIDALILWGSNTKEIFRNTLRACFINSHICKYAFMIDKLFEYKLDNIYEYNEEANEILEYCIKNPKLKKIIEEDINRRLQELKKHIEDENNLLSYIKYWKSKHKLADSNEEITRANIKKILKELSTI